MRRRWRKQYRTILRLEAKNDGQGLMEILTGGDYSDHQAYAAEALGRIGWQPAIDPLIRMLTDEIGRDAAARALGMLGDARAVEPLMEQLERPLEAHANLAWAEQVARSLGQMGDGRAVGPLRDLLVRLDRADSRFEQERERTMVAVTEALASITGDASDVDAATQAQRAVSRREATGGVGPTVRVDSTRIPTLVFPRLCVCCIEPSTTTRQHRFGDLRRSVGTGTLVVRPPDLAVPYCDSHAVIYDKVRPYADRDAGGAIRRIATRRDPDVAEAKRYLTKNGPLGIEVDIELDPSQLKPEEWSYRVILKFRNAQYGSAFRQLNPWPARPAGTPLE